MLNRTILPVLILLTPLCLLATSKDNERPPLEYHDISRTTGIQARTVIEGSDDADFLLATSGGAVALIDFNNDEQLDVFLVNGWGLNGFEGRDQPHSSLYRNNGDRSFTDVSQETGAAVRGWGQGVCAGDYDNNGFIDLFVTLYGDGRLLKNTGGNFSLVDAAQSGIDTTRRWNTGCTFVDYDRDGDLDLFVANYVVYRHGLTLYKRESGTSGVSPIISGVERFQGDSNLLFRNNGDGSFSDVSDSSGITKVEPGLSFTPIALDYNGDSWPDLFVANDSTPNRLYLNQQDGTFREVGLLAGVAYNEDAKALAGMGVDAGDFNGDELSDLIVTNFSNQPVSLYRNVRGFSFTDVTFPAGLGTGLDFVKWGTHFLDVDLDGLLDLFIANGPIYPPGVRRESQLQSPGHPNLIYRNTGNGRFQDISQQAGPAMQTVKCSRGSAAGDLFNSGQLNLVINNINETPEVLENVKSLNRHWLTLRLIGTRTNRSAIGSVVRLQSQGRLQTREVRSGGSFCSQNDLRLHFGLGGSERADWIEIKWLSGRIERYENVPADGLIVIEEGSGIRK